MHRKGPICSRNKWLMSSHLPIPKVVAVVVSLITRFHTLVNLLPSSKFITYFLSDIRQSTTKHIYNVVTASSVEMNLIYCFIGFDYIQYNMICFKFQLNGNCFVPKSQTQLSKLTKSFWKRRPANNIFK